MKQAEIIRVDGPIPLLAPSPRMDATVDPAAVMIYSVQLASGLVVTSPDKYPAAPLHETDSGQD